MPSSSLLMPNIPRIAVLIDLPRGAHAGGHVKYWEFLAQAAAKNEVPVDLTFYFSGTGADDVLSPHVRYRYLPPVFSTAQLKFMPYLPAHTDLAPFHPKLADELANYDVIHTTDAFFAFAKTAERVARWYHIPLITSLHTDTPAYAEIFTHSILQNLLGRRMGRWIDDVLKISSGSRKTKTKRLASHMRQSHAILTMRDQDVELARSVTSPNKIKPFRLAVDKDIFKPRPDARALIEKKYGIGPGKFIVLFVGRVDIGKNMPLLMKACARLIERNIPLHLLVVGRGPMAEEVKATLGDNTTLTGQLLPEDLAYCYAAADCLAMASDVEIGGLVGLEALACGCPVLVSQASGVAQAAGATNVMEMVESSEPDWGIAIVRLVENKKKQAQMRQAATDYASEKLANWKEVLDNDFLPVWQNLGKR